jgi:hypothetical protein
LGAPTGAITAVGGPNSGSVTDERAWQYADVACERCGATVQVAKFSAEHTSVQWTDAAVSTCAEFSAEEAAGRPSALIATCTSLWSSIGAAVRGGRVQILPP